MSASLASSAAGCNTPTQLRLHGAVQLSFPASKNRRKTVSCFFGFHVTELQKQMKFASKIKRRREERQRKPDKRTTDRDDKERQARTNTEAAKAPERTTGKILAPSGMPWAALKAPSGFRSIHGYIKGDEQTATKTHKSTQTTMTTCSLSLLANGNLRSLIWIF